MKRVYFVTEFLKLFGLTEDQVDSIGTVVFVLVILILAAGIVVPRLHFKERFKRFTASFGKNLRWVIILAAAAVLCIAGLTFAGNANREKQENEAAALLESGAYEQAAAIYAELNMPEEEKKANLLLADQSAADGHCEQALSIYQRYGLQDQAAMMGAQLEQQKLAEEETALLERISAGEEDTVAASLGKNADSAHTARLLLRNEQLQALAFRPGNIVQFKTFRNQSDLPWIVLAQEDGRALLLCLKEQEAAGAYDAADRLGTTLVRWESSDCRARLKTMLNDFDHDVRAAIVPTVCDNTVFRDGEVAADEPTTDELFALSLDEMDPYGGYIAAYMRQNKLDALSFLTRSASYKGELYGTGARFIREDNDIVLYEHYVSIHTVWETHPAMWVDVQTLLNAWAE